MKGSGLVMGGVIGGCIGMILSGMWFITGIIVGVEIERKLCDREGVSKDA